MQFRKSCGLCREKSEVQTHFSSFFFFFYFLNKFRVSQNLPAKTILAAIQLQCAGLDVGAAAGTAMAFLAFSA